ncbi:10316_t:CDS:2, partial [Dentiscutata heterogama]
FTNCQKLAEKENSDGIFILQDPIFVDFWRHRDNNREIQVLIELSVSYQTHVSSDSLLIALSAPDISL